MFDDIDRLQNRPERRHFMATVVGLNRGTKTIITDEYSVIEVVDGQQRLPTLIVLKAIQLSLADQPKLSAELQAILIKQDELSLILLQMNHDPNGYFAEYLRHGTAADPAVAKTIRTHHRFNSRWPIKRGLRWTKLGFLSNRSKSTCAVSMRLLRQVCNWLMRWIGCNLQIDTSRSNCAA